MKAKLRRLYLGLSGRYGHIKRKVKCKKEWYGNNYGGFYLNSNLISKDSIVYSFGIGQDISFDSAIIEKHDCKVFGFDPTPKSIEWCKKQVLSQNFQFYDYGIAQSTGNMKFNLPKEEKHISGSIINHNNVSQNNFIDVKMKSFSDIANTLNHHKISVLKMDIEGSEYDIIDSILQSNISIDQLLIEFHERFFIDGKNRTIQTIKKLSERGFEIFAISDSFEEISFVRTSIL